MTTKPSNAPPEERIRSTALSHARNLEDQKAMRNRVLDLVIQVVDLPSNPTSNPARPLAADVALLKQGLCLFQPSDLDDVILERNVYDKCGYGLCPRPNTKVEGSSENRIIWGKRSGPAFKIVPRAELERWCSKVCEDRTAFIRVQLGKEPAWLRSSPIQEIKLLDESDNHDSDQALVRDVSTLDIDTTPASGSEVRSSLEKGRQDQADVTERLKQLSIERGDRRAPGEEFDSQMEIIEKLSVKPATAPELVENGGGAIEGYQPR
jgi:RNA polymerase II-associated protein 2